MYKITILTSGKFGNAIIGDRYTFTKRAAKKFIKYCLEWECDFTILKFIHCANGIFAWSNISVNELFKK